MTIVRSEEYYKYHTFNTDDLEKHGFERAVILGNIEKFNDGFEFKEIYKYFPYIDKSMFYYLINELIISGFLRNISKMPEISR